MFLPRILLVQPRSKLLSLSSTQTPRPSKQQQQCQARLSSRFYEDQLLSNHDLDIVPIDIDADSVADTGGEVTDHGDKGEITGNESTQDQAPISSFMSETDLIRILMEQFDLKVIGGLEAGLRAGVREKMLENAPLLPKENNAVVNSIIQIVFDQLSGSS